MNDYLVGAAIMFGSILAVLSLGFLGWRFLDKFFSYFRKGD